MSYSWNNVYDTWQYVCKDLFEPILTDPGFKLLEFEFIPNASESTRNNGSFIKWIGIEALNHLISDIPINGISDVTWRIAHIETAKMLWKYKGNLEAMALIWIGAILTRYDKSERCMSKLIKHLNYQYFRDLQFIINGKFEELEMNRWSSHVKYPVPDCLLENHYMGMLSPTNMDELIGLIALEAVYLRTRWQLIDIRLI
jgi:hypothetical protein